jgi:hypothetical protein
MKCYVWSTALYDAEAWTLRKLDYKYLESFETWWWRRLDKISWTDLVRNKEVLHRLKEYPTYNKKGKLIGSFTSCVGTVFQNTLLKES